MNLNEHASQRKKKGKEKEKRVRKQENNIWRVM